MLKIIGLGAAVFAAATVAGALAASSATAAFGAQVCGPYLVTGDTGGRGTRSNPQYLALTPLATATTDGVDWSVTVLQNSKKNPNRYTNSGVVVNLRRARLVMPDADGKTAYPCRDARSGDVTVRVSAARDGAPATRAPATHAPATRAPAAPSRAAPGTAVNAYGPGGMARPSEMSEFPVNAAGRALGGRMRAGPGTDAAHVASLPENTPVTVTHGTPEWMNGYLWYGVEANGRRGYVWGGILCAPGRDLPGMFRCQ